MTMAMNSDALDDAFTVDQWAAWPLRVPLRKPYRSAKGTLSSLPMLHTSVRTREGVVGHSVIFVPSAALADAVVAVVAGLRSELGDVGRTAFGHAALIRKRLGAWGGGGVGASAASALELALVEACSQHRRLSVASLLGLDAKPLATYGGIAQGEVEETVQEAQRLVQAGHRALKLKLGHNTVEQDIEALAAVREAVTQDIRLMVDFNQSLSVQEAIRRGKALERFDLVWMEEPVPAADLEGHAAVASSLSTCLQSGENWWSARQIARAIELHACDAVMLDPAKLGIQAWLEAAEAARAAKVPVSSHLSPHLCAQLLCATDAAGWLEWTDWWKPFVGATPVSDGRVIPSDAPVAWDDDALCRYRVTG